MTDSAFDPLGQAVEQNISGEKKILTVEDLDALLAKLPAPPATPAPRIAQVRTLPETIRHWDVTSVTDLFEVQHCKQCDGVTTSFAGRMLGEVSNTGAERNRRLAHVDPEVRENLDLTALRYDNKMINVTVPICRDCSQEVRFANNAFDALVSVEPQLVLF